MNGDWTIMPEGLIKEIWLRYYTSRDQMMDLLVSRINAETGEIIHTSEVAFSYHVMEARRYIAGDTAGGMKDLTEASKGKTKSWTVFGVWDYHQHNNSQSLMLRDVFRARCSFTEACDALRELYVKWHPSSIRVEENTMGVPLVDLLQREMPITTIGTGGIDKVSRAAPLMNMLQRGEVYLPVGQNSWKNTIETEWLSWQGLATDTNDQVDMAAYAAMEAGGFSGGTMTLEFDPREQVSLGPAMSAFKSRWGRT